MQENNKINYGVTILEIEYFININTVFPIVFALNEADIE
jgi:hypothetical protein